MNVDVIKMGKKESRYILIRNFCVASKVTLEHAPENPSIYGITPGEESEDVKTWVDRAHLDRFILIVSKT